MGEELQEVAEKIADGISSTIRREFKRFLEEKQDNSTFSFLE